MLSRRISQRWLPQEELSVLQHMIVLVGQNCNPVSAAKDRSLQGCREALSYAFRHPQLLQRDVADFVFMGSQSLMKHRQAVLLKSGLATNAAVPREMNKLLDTHEMQATHFPLCGHRVCSVVPQGSCCDESRPNG